MKFMKKYGKEIMFMALFMVIFLATPAYASEYAQKFQNEIDYRSCLDGSNVCCCSKMFFKRNDCPGYTKYSSRSHLNGYT